MKIKEFQIYRYHLPLLQSFRIGKTFISSRTGAIIHIKTTTDYQEFSEAAPLPGLHRENINEVERKLVDIKSQLIGTKIVDSIDIVDNLQNKDDWPPSVQFAVESAILNISDKLNLTGQKYIMPKPETNIIYINSLVSGDNSKILQFVENCKSQNYKSIKIKVGQNKLDEELNLVRAIRKIIGEKITLRLDANQAWNLEDAITFARSVEDLAIEYIEEPLKDLGKLETLYRKTGVPIALDESINNPFSESIVVKNWVNTLVLKPAVIGSIRKNLQFIKGAKDSGCKIVFSDTFHSGVGLSFMIRLASIIKEPVPMGFDTYRWLENDILDEKLPMVGACFDLRTAMKFSQQVNFLKLVKVE